MQFNLIKKIDNYLGRFILWVFRIHISFDEGLKLDGRTTVQVRRFKGYDKDGQKLYGNWFDVVRDKHNLITDAGQDFFSAQCLTNTSAGTRGAGFIALSENATAPAVTDTTVAGEITTNGLARADAGTKTHTAGTDTTVIEHTFTASGAFTAVQKSGLLNASSAGTLFAENTFTSTALATNDQIKVTWTITQT